MAYQKQSLDLGRLFGAVLESLHQHRQSLNQADDFNHDHGDNMVETFSTITRSMEQSRGSAHSEQMAFAARDLRRSSSSSSAQVYADGLLQASREYRGRQVTQDNALDLIQMLLGGGQVAQPQPGSRGLGDLLGTLLGGQQQQQPQPQPGSAGVDDLLGSMFSGGQQQQPQPPQQSSGGLGDLLGSMLGGGQQQQQQPQPQSSGGLGDLLGTLLGGGQQQPQPQQQSSGGLGDLLGTLLGGGQQQPAKDDGISAGDLMRAAVAYMKTKSRGGSNLEAIVSAVVAASALGSGYREQSSSLVVNALLGAIQGMAGGR